MKKELKNICFGAALLTLLLGSCSNEDTPTPSTGTEPFWSLADLPQGDHEYDQRIVELSEKYNSVILYKFDIKEFYWNVTSDIRWWGDKYDSFHPGYDAKVADENYVGELVKLLEEKVIVHFPDTLLTRTMPHKVLLLSKLDYAAEMFPSGKITWETIDAYSGYDYLAFNWANADIEAFTPADRTRFKSKGCAAFLNRLADKELIERSSEFHDLTNYSASYSTTSDYPSDADITKLRQQGIINWSSRADQMLDWKDYVNAITGSTLEQLEAEGGILNASFDKYRRIRAKYDLIVAHFKERYNIDLQAIGDDSEE